MKTVDDLPKSKIIPIKDYLKIPPINCQRNIEHRLSRTKRNLINNPQPSQYQVAIIRYDGKEVVGNGNTRAAVWRGMLAEDPDHPLVPSHVVALYYDRDSEKAAEAVYYTFDSQDATEKTNEIITGLYNKMGVKSKLKNKKIRSGKIVKAVEYADPGLTTRQSRKTTSRHERYAVMLQNLMPEILKLDKSDPDWTSDSWNSHTACATLMVLRKYRDNPSVTKKILQGLDNINNQVVKGNTTEGYDGITFLIREMETKKIFKTRGTSAQDMPLVLDFVLYCFEKWIDDQPIKSYRAPSNKSRGRRSLFHTWWDGFNHKQLALNIDQ